jgi:glycosyltransferase involved in cell wall biosynthesis
MPATLRLQAIVDSILISASHEAPRPPADSHTMELEGASGSLGNVLGSVVIPAHNEANVIGRCLDALLRGFAPGELHVVVVCNGCSDGTATVVRTGPHSVHVLELESASKPAALRAGDEAANAVLPRLYVDADVVLSSGAARRVLDRLATGAMAARPPIQYDTSRSSGPVRRFYRARTRIPAVMGSLWGAGVCGLSARGRARFGAFPDILGDDLWLDRQFEPTEIEIVDCEPVLVAAPRRTRDLVRVLQRIYGGNNQIRNAGSGHDDRGQRITRSALRDLLRLARSGPAEALDAATYSALAVIARLALARTTAAGDSSEASRWQRDESSRIN